MKIKKLGVFFFASLFLISFLVLASYGEIKVAADPSRMAVGARMLGMGKMGLTLLDDCSTMYVNSAGIGTLKDWQITTMFSKFIGEIDYLQFSGVYPTDFGSFGIGYTHSGIAANFPNPTLVEVVSGEWRVIPSSTEGSSYSFYNSVLLLSYAVPPKRFLNWDFLNNLTLGTNIKIFSVGLSGPGISGGSGSGYNMDMGLLYTPITWLSLGLSGSNIIPPDAGGTLKWSSGTEEKYTGMGMLGVSTKILGEGALYRYGNHELTFGLDSRFLDPTLPMLFNVGAEWWPTEFTALRFGVDQDYVGTGGGGVEPYNNFTAGVGFLYSGFRFDYAYHQYNNIPENDTHYFSISYNIWKEKPTPPPTVFMRVLEPKDKTVIYNDSVSVIGEILDGSVKQIKVNGQNIPLSGKAFKTTLPMALGKNGILVEAIDESGKILDSAKIRILRLISFKDVGDDYWAKDTIGKIATVGIVTGYPDGTFKPEGGITRAEMTTLLVRAKGAELLEPTGEFFIDLPKTHWAAKYVETGSKAGLVQGYPDKTFRPSSGITRAEGITVISRFDGLQEPEKIAIAPYEDVPGRHWAAKIVTVAKSAGLLEHFKDANLEPSKPLNRAESVDILSRTRYAKQKIDDLMNWETGYTFTK